MNVEQQKEEIKPTSTNTNMNLHTLTFKVIGTLQEIEWYEKQLTKIGNTEYIIGLIDEMINDFVKRDETFTHLQEAAHDAKIRTLIQLKQKIEKEL